MLAIGGTMRYEALGDLFDVADGSFYKYVKGDGEYKLLENIFISNGMAWNEMENKFYYIDSGKFDVREFDYDPKTGDICKYKFTFELMRFMSEYLLFYFLLKQMNVSLLILK